jgi:hypothetical protein
MNIYTEIKACDPTVKEAAEKLVEFGKDLDVTHLKLLENSRFIKAFASWFESLDSEEKKEAKEDFGNTTFQCIKDLYEFGINNGTITDDSVLTEEIILFAAEDCIDDDILEEIEYFFEHDITVIDAGKDLIQFGEDFNVTHLDNLREFEFFNIFCNWFESLDSDRKDTVKHNLEEHTFGCIGDLYDQGIANQTITDDTKLTEVLIVGVAIECLDKDTLAEIAVFYDDDIPVNEGADDDSSE